MVYNSFSLFFIFFAPLYILYSVYGPRACMSVVQRKEYRDLMEKSVLEPLSFLYSRLHKLHTKFYTFFVEFLLNSMHKNVLEWVVNIFVQVLSEKCHLEMEII